MNAFKKFFLTVSTTVTVLCLVSSGAFAATLIPGDTFYASASPTGFLHVPVERTIDKQFQAFDFYSNFRATANLNAPDPGGEILTLNSPGAYSNGANGLGGPRVMWEFTDLDFTGGEIITGFTILQDFGNAIVSFTANSVKIEYLDIAITEGVFFSGRFTTGTISAVPLPAALPLYGAGMALMGFIGWRKKRITTA